MRYAHTNLVARDWRDLARFYIDVLGCEPVSSERDHGGPLFEALTGMPGAKARGQHLRVPGHGPKGPTLEIFQFVDLANSEPPRLNRPGLAHLAFEVDDVEAKRRAFLEKGGGQVGALVTLDIPGAGRLTLVYMSDPEGNIVELQRWH
jgi:catechol 2,3-dioxygenase-like lactoylglutathione lyase family enzyme